MAASEMQTLARRISDLEEENKALKAQLAQNHTLLEQKNAVLKEIKDLDSQKRQELAATVSALTRAGSPSIRFMASQRPMTVSISSTVLADCVKYTLTVSHNGLVEPYCLIGRSYSDFRSFRQVLLQAAYMDAAPHLSIFPFCTDSDAIETQTLTRLTNLSFPPKRLFGNMMKDVIEARRADLETYLQEVVQICRLASRGSSVRRVVTAWIEITAELEDSAWRSSMPVSVSRLNI